MTPLMYIYIEKKMDEKVSYYDIIFDMTWKIQNWHGCLNWITCDHARALLFIKYAFLWLSSKSLRRWLAKSFIFVSQPITRDWNKDVCWIYNIFPFKSTYLILTDNTTISPIISRVNVLNIIRLFLHQVFQLQQIKTIISSNIILKHVAWQCRYIK